MPSHAGGFLVIVDELQDDALRDAGLEVDLMIAHLAAVRRRPNATASETASAYRAAASALAHAATMASAAEHAERFSKT